MTILIIDNSNGFTGAFKCALSEAILLSDEHKFIFAVPLGSTNQSLLKENGFAVYDLSMKEISKSLRAVMKYPFYLFANVVRLKRIISKERVDAVQVNDFYNLLGAGLRISGSKVKLVTYVRFLPSSLPSSLRSFWTRIAQRYSNYVIAVSDAVLNQLPQTSNTLRVYDPVLFAERIPEKGYNDDVLTCLYLSNFTRGKGQEYALQAFAKAYDRNKHIKLHFVGGDLGLEKNRLFKKELQNTAELLGLNEVVFFSEFESNVEELIKESYMLLNFSDAESFSMTCLEASYYGTPVIATKSGGPEEIVTDKISGFLVERRNVDQMSEAILNLAFDPALRLRFSEAGKEIVRKKFSIEAYKEKFKQILDSLNK